MVQKNPDQVVAIESEQMESTPDGGEVYTLTQEGDRGSIQPLYVAAKALQATGGAAVVTYKNANGRAVLISKYLREDKELDEVYAVDVLKDIYTATYFESLTDEQVREVRTAFEDQEESPSFAEPLQTKLYTHLIHGVESVFETQFVYRRTIFAMKTAAVKATFTNINTVVSAPSPSGAIGNLLDSLPSGEWLYKTPQAEYSGRGKWRVTQEWWWALKWSVVYGGTWFA
jgi:hypothetical protein